MYRPIDGNEEDRQTKLRQETQNIYTKKQGRFSMVSNSSGTANDRDEQPKKSDRYPKRFIGSLLSLVIAFANVISCASWSTDLSIGGRIKTQMASVDPITADAEISTDQATRSKTLICVRHATSLANEMMARPGNEWGDPNFTDDVSLLDAPLSEAGRAQLENLKSSTNKDQMELMSSVELVLVSPMRRCLQTYDGAVRGLLERSKADHVPVIACPLLTERVYTASDTGRPLDVVKKEYPDIDFSGCHDEWWYTCQAGTYQEWRPHGEKQWYGVPGEPELAFSDRMMRLEEYIRNRKESNVLLVTHWGVLSHLARGQAEFQNAEVRVIQFE